jgi:hypothetical protein
VTPSGDNPLNGDEMKTGTQSQSQQHEATASRFSTTDRFPLALFVVVELLCTGALVASVILWM